MTGRQFAYKPERNTKNFSKTPTPGIMKQEETRNPMGIARHVTFRIARVSRRRDSRLPCLYIYIYGFLFGAHMPPHGVLPLAQVEEGMKKFQLCAIG